MNNKTSKVIICKNIKIDKNYQNVLTYTEQQMVTLCNQNKVASADNFSFIDYNNNIIRVPFRYADCLTCNYIAFQNPNYSNKWFFAFIDSIQYSSEKSTIINYTIDIFSTWFDYWTVKSCFVIREHTMDDRVGYNTIPEGLETGDFVCDSMTPINIGASLDYTVVAVSEVVNIFSGPINPYYSVYTGIYSGLRYLVFDNYTSVSNFIRSYEDSGKIDAINSVFILPQNLFPDVNWGTVTYTPLNLSIKFGIINNSTDYIDMYTTPVISSPLTINGYTPVNNKLFIGDYNYLLVSNNIGQDYVYKYEDFISNEARFKVVGAITIGGSIKAIPMNYKKLQDIESEDMFSWPYGITAPKYPTCSWISDPYINWLTQNSVNVFGGEVRNLEIGAGLITSAIGGVLALTGVGTTIGIGMMAGGAMSVFNSLQQNYQHDKVPLQARGAGGSGDITYSAGHMYLPAYKMTIRQEYARSIDDFFTRFGYKTNKLKIPNQTGRSYFNYVEIGKGETIGNPNNKGCPADAMELINNIYRNGVTLWHDHSRIGNYTNNIIQ